MQRLQYPIFRSFLFWKYRVHTYYLQLWVSLGNTKLNPTVALCMTKTINKLCVSRELVGSYMAAQGTMLTRFWANTQNVDWTCRYLVGRSTTLKIEPELKMRSVKYVARCTKLRFNRISSSLCYSMDDFKGQTI